MSSLFSLWSKNWLRIAWIASIALFDIFWKVLALWSSLLHSRKLRLRIARIMLFGLLLWFSDPQNTIVARMEIGGYVRDFWRWFRTVVAQRMWKEQFLVFRSENWAQNSKKRTYCVIWNFLNSSDPLITSVACTKIFRCYLRLWRPRGCQLNYSGYLGLKTGLRIARIAKIAVFELFWKVLTLSSPLLYCRILRVLSGIFKGDLGLSWPRGWQRKRVFWSQNWAPWGMFAGIDRFYSLLELT